MNRIRQIREALRCKRCSLKQIDGKFVVSRWPKQQTDKKTIVNRFPTIEALNVWIKT